MYRSQHQCRLGLSLVEVAVSSLLVGTVAIGSLSMLGASVRTQTATNNLLDGPRLADELLAEIMSMPYEDPTETGAALGLDSDELGTSRTDFDDVDDYVSWSNSPPEDKDGNEHTEYVGWSRSVTVGWARLLNGNIFNGYDTGLKRILVTVTSPEGDLTTRFGFRFKEGSLEQAPTVDKTVVTYVKTHLSLGTAANPEILSTNLLNHVEDPNP